MTLIDYTALFERRYDLWCDYDPWTYPDEWPFVIKDGANWDEVMTRTGSPQTAAAWLRAFSHGSGANVTVDWWSLCVAVRTANQWTLSEGGAGSEGSDPGTPGVRQHGTAVPSAPLSESVYGQNAQHSVKARPRLRMVEPA